MLPINHVAGRLVWPTSMLAGALAVGLAGSAHASLLTFASYSGNVAHSTDAWGGLTNSGAVTANAPSGSSVIAAYLYTASWGGANTAPTTVTLNGTSVGYNNTSVNTSDTTLASHRADVTSIVKPVIDGGAGGAYNFAIDEGADGSSLDGSALVVVYENSSLPDASVGILDGFSAQGGDSTAINFADPLDPSDPAFFAEMRLGIGFSCCTQSSDVSVNGTLITENAGNNDDGDEVGNGSLITMGSDDDPFSPLLPSYTDDHERYNLVDYISNGDTSIAIETNNPSFDDNIFLATFYVSGEAGFNEPPPSDDTPVIPLPAPLLMLGTSLLGFGVIRRRSGS